MKDSEALSEAARTIEAGFCKDAYAKDAQSRRVGVMDPNATCFCLVGAVAKALGGSILAADKIVDHWVAPIVPKTYLPLGMIGDPIPKFPRAQTIKPRAWNDQELTSSYAVAHLLKTAAKAAEKEGV